MCGIYGMAKHPSHISKKHRRQAKQIITSLAISSESRGRQSSGLAEIGKGSMLIHKSLSPSSEFVKTTQFKNALRRINDINIYIGHTRFATMGEVKLDNAHPYQIGNTIGAHNGCLYNTTELEKAVGHSCEVDTQYLFTLVDREQSIQDAVKHIEGDFAISFVKDNSHTLHLAREKNRPLWVSYWTKARTLFYASERGFLEKAFASVNVECDYAQLNTNELYSFDTRKFDGIQTNVKKLHFEYKSREYQVFSNYVEFDDVDVDVEFGTNIEDIPNDTYITAEEILSMEESVIDIAETLWPSCDRDTSEYWEYHPDELEWYFLDTRDRKWYRLDTLTTNQLALVDRLYDYELNTIAESWYDNDESEAWYAS